MVTFPPLVTEQLVLSVAACVLSCLAADLLADFFCFFFLSPPVCLLSYQLRIECMLLCEETLSVLDMLKPKVKLVEEGCHCK